MDKQAALYLHSLGSKKTAGDANDKGQEGQPRKSQSELGQQYATTLRTIGDNLSRLERDQITYDREALEVSILSEGASIANGSTVAIVIVCYLT